jgi:hypothetical protein
VSSTFHGTIFPIDQPVMPEDRQIGRRPSIDALERRIGGAVHQWLIGPRRIGKTSVAKAVVARLQTDHVVALDVDFSKLEISTSQGLAGCRKPRKRLRESRARPTARSPSYSPAARSLQLGHCANRAGRWRR